MIPSATNVNSFSATAKTVLIDSTYGYLGAWAFTSINPVAGLIFGSSLAVLAKVNSAVFQQNGSSSEAKNMGNFLAFVGSSAATYGICAAVAIPLTFKASIILILTTLVSFFVFGTIARVADKNLFNGYFTDSLMVR